MTRAVEIKKQLEWSIRSQQNVLSIQEYVANDNPIAAARVLEHIALAGKSLIEFPMTGKPWLREGTRKLVLTKFPYSIIYKLTATKVIVLAVAHQSRKHT
ncbi:MAG: addiction module antitoxin [Gallionellaceae bacterium]|nr:MAG: addiction module antitoxin [Gallionellaceae bacterium]